MLKKIEPVSSNLYAISYAIYACFQRSRFYLRNNITKDMEQVSWSAVLDMSLTDPKLISETNFGRTIYLLLKLLFQNWEG